MNPKSAIRVLFHRRRQADRNRLLRVYRGHIKERPWFRRLWRTFQHEPSAGGSVTLGEEEGIGRIRLKSSIPRWSSFRIPPLGSHASGSIADISPWGQVRVDDEQVAGKILGARLEFFQEQGCVSAGGRDTSSDPSMPAALQGISTIRRASEHCSKDMVIFFSSHLTTAFGGSSGARHWEATETHQTLSPALYQREDSPLAARIPQQPYEILPPGIFSISEASTLMFPRDVSLRTKYRMSRAERESIQLDTKSISWCRTRHDTIVYVGSTHLPTIYRLHGSTGPSNGCRILLCFLKSGTLAELQASITIKYLFPPLYEWQPR